MFRKVNGKDMDSIYDELLAKMEQSKKEFFIISEQSRQAYEEMKDELENIRISISAVIKTGDLMEDKTHVARRRLAEVSGAFNTYSEQQIRESYEKANDLQVQLSANRFEEKKFRQK